MNNDKIVVNVENTDLSAKLPWHSKTVLMWQKLAASYDAKFVVGVDSVSISEK